MKKTAKQLWISAALFLIAIFVSGYLIYNHYALINGELGFGSFCSINKSVDCDVVNASHYSEIAGVPLAVLGMAYYLLALVLTIVSLRSAYWRREALITLAGLSFGSVLFSGLTLFWSLVRIKAVCLMCITLQTINIVSFTLIFFASTEFLRELATTAGRKLIQAKRIGIFLGIGAFFLGAIHLVTAQMKQTLPFDEEQFVRELRATPSAEIDIKEGHKQGFQGPNPKLLLVEFADFQCPACGMAARHMHRLLKVYGDQVQLVFKNFPLDPGCNPLIKMPMHPYGCVAARASHCAKEQGHFEEYYQVLFANQHEISREKLRDWADKFKMDLGRFDQCLDAATTRDAVARDVESGLKAGLESTPTFFANGKKIQGVITEDRLKVLLRELGK